MIAYRALFAALLAGSAAPLPSPFVARDGAELRSLVVREVLPQEAAGPTVVIASTDQSDRMDDIVDQATWKLDQYRANPVILWAHNNSIFPVGKCVSVSVVENKLVMAIEWDEATEHGATCARQFKEGFLSAVSVGFKPGRVISRSQLPKDDARYKEGGYGVVYYDCVLLECSAVPVPANPGALVLQRSAETEALDAAIEGAVAAETIRRATQALAEIPARIDAAVRDAAAKATAEIRDDVVAAVRQHLDETAERAIATKEPTDWWTTDSQPEAQAQAQDWWG